MAVGGIILFFFLLFFLLQTSRIQQAVARSLTKDISERIKSNVTIGGVDYKFFNTISLRDVYVEDLRGDTLLSLDVLNAQFSLFQFLKGRVIFYSLEFDGLYANLLLDEGGESNFKFLIDAFSNPAPKEKESDIEYVIHLLQLKNSALRFNNYNARDGSLPPGQIDFNRLYFDQINGGLTLNVLNKDTLSAAIKNFSAVEQSGLHLVNLKTELAGSVAGLVIPEIDIALPASKLHLTDIALDYDSIADFKQFANKIKMEGRLHSSYVTLNDLAAFMPQLKDIPAQATLEASLEGWLSNLRLEGINIKYGESFALEGNLDLNGLPDLEQTFVYGNLKELRLNGDDTEKFLSEIMRQPYRLPEEIKRLGTVSYKGNVTGFISNLVIYGNLASGIGRLSTDVLLQFENNFRDLSYNGTLKSSGLDLGYMFQTEYVGNISFYFNTTGSRKMNSSFQGIIDANVPEFQLYGYNYQDIRLKGTYDGTGFNGSLAVQDENINVDFNGLIDLTQELPVFDFDLIVKETNLNELNLTEKYPGSVLSFNGKTNMRGNSLDNINGFLRFDSVHFINNKKELFVDEIEFVSHTEKDYTNFAIKSKYINGSLSGSFQYSSLLATATQIVQEYLPALEEKNIKKRISNRIDIDLTVAETEELSDAFDFPYKIKGAATIKGYIDEDENIIDIMASVPRFIFGRRYFNSTTLHLWGEKEKLEFIVESNVPTETDFWNIALYAAAQNDILTADMEWRNKQKVVNKGEFRTSTTFQRNDDNRIVTTTSILPSLLTMSDTQWYIDESSIVFQADKSIQVNDFQFGSDSQYLRIDGLASKNQQDSLNIEMKDVDLGFISNILNIKGFHIGGITTGSALILSMFNRPVFDAVLAVKDLRLNHKPVGDASIFSTWDQVHEKVLAIASVTSGKETAALAECVYTPSDNTLDVLLDANRLSINFLTPYFESILPNTQGYASGRLNISGPLNAIRFDGKLRVDDGELTVGILGSTFSLNDTIVMTPNSITFPNITLYDAEKNKVVVDGALTHDGRFKDFKYNLNVQAKNAQVANLSPGENELFFGKAYADAAVRIRGSEDEITIRVNALTKPGTKVYIQTGSSSQATDAGFIQFVEHHDEDDLFLYTPRETVKNSTNLKLNLQIEATPDAEVELIIDPAGGDMLSGKGSGNIRIEYDNSQAETKMYGTYVIESGNYLFTLQDVFRKEFRIESGSSILWTGSPSSAQVNIRAVYSLTASLKDLFDTEDYELTFSQNTRSAVPVNCILILTDNLMSPTIKFDIDLPSSDEGLKQIVRNSINTEEMITTQVLYLLVFNKFYMPNYGSNVTNIGGSEFMSLAASTVSSQLNNFIAQFSKNNAFSLGLDIRRSDEVNMEYQLDLIYQPSDRWIVNGNFGYRQNNLEIENYNKFITDFDIEYLLTKSGKLRFKVYNHTIDRAQLKTAKNTQGLGFMYKEDFDSVGGLFRYYWKLIKNIGKKEENEETEETEAD